MSRLLAFLSTFRAPRISRSSRFNRCCIFFHMLRKVWERETNVSRAINKTFAFCTAFSAQLRLPWLFSFGINEALAEWQRGKTYGTALSFGSVSPIWTRRIISYFCENKYEGPARLHFKRFHLSLIVRLAFDRWNRGWCFEVIKLRVLVESLVRYADLVCSQ